MKAEETDPFWIRVRCGEGMKMFPGEGLRNDEVKAGNGLRSTGVRI